MRDLRPSTKRKGTAKAHQDVNRNLIPFRASLLRGEFYKAVEDRISHFMELADIRGALATGPGWNSTGRSPATS